MADDAEQGKLHYREMTVAQLREPPDADYVEVVFLESARFYRLSKKDPALDEALRRLRGALATGRALKVGTSSLDSDVIADIRA